VKLPTTKSEQSKISFWIYFVDSNNENGKEKIHELNESRCCMTDDKSKVIGTKHVV
jgi:hypothetical protein